MLAVVRTEVAVVGGGVVGLATAHELARRGVEVTVVEADHIGAGASSGNAGWLVPALSAPIAAPGMLGHALHEMLRRDGALRARPSVALTSLAWLTRFARHCNPADHLAGLRATAALATRGLEAYDALADAGVAFTMTCAGLLSAYLSAPAARRGAADLAPLTAFGYGEPVVLDAADVHAVEPTLSDGVEAGYLLEGERAVDPSSLLAGLTDDLRARGVRIVEGWAVSGFEMSGDRVTALVGRDMARIQTQRVVLAAGAWSDRLLRKLGSRAWLQAGKGYSYSARPVVAPRRPVMFAEAKSGVSPLGDRVRVVGHLDVDGLSGRLARRRTETLRRVAARYLRDWPDDIDEPWCGLRSVTPDGLPVLSRVPTVSNVTVGAGHGLLGVTLAVASAVLLTELTLGAPVTMPVADAFRLERFERQPMRYGASRAVPARAQVPTPVTAKSEEL